MSSRTKLICQSVFRCGNEKYVHGRPFGSSLYATAHPKLLRILPHGASLFQRNAASVKNKGQKMNKNVKLWHSLKVKAGFLILLINLKTGATQWRMEVGRQRGTKVREAVERGTGLWTSCPPPSPPPLHTHTHTHTHTRTHTHTHTRIQGYS